MAGLKERGFVPVFDERGRYASGFDPERTYDFMCAGWTSVRRLRLCDAPPRFNLYGLHWREITVILRSVENFESHSHNM